MPKTESSRADAKVKEIKKRISLLSPEFKRKFTDGGPVGDLIDGLRATGNAAKKAWNARKVDAMLKRVKKLQAASDEAKDFKSTKRFMAGDEFAKYDSSIGTLLKKAKGKK